MAGRDVAAVGLVVLINFSLSLIVCIKDLEYNTPKYVFSWGGVFPPPPVAQRESICRRE